MHLFYVLSIGAIKLSVIQCFCKECAISYVKVVALLIYHYNYTI